MNTETMVTHEDKKTWPQLDEKKTAELWEKSEPRFCVDLVTKRFPGFKRMNFRLFHNEMKEDINDLIVFSDEVSDNPPYWESYVEQTFTQTEVDLMRRFFEGDEDEIIASIAGPPDNNCMGCGALAVGGRDDFYTFDRTEGYDLPFKVWGYFCRDNKEDWIYEPSDFAIRFSPKTKVDSTCPICDQPVTTAALFQVIAGYKWRPVCEKCIRQHAPELLNAAEVLAAAFARPNDAN